MPDKELNRPSMKAHFSRFLFVSVKTKLGQEYIDEFLFSRILHKPLSFFPFASSRLPESRHKTRHEFVGLETDNN